MPFHFSKLTNFRKQGALLYVKSDIYQTPLFEQKRNCFQCQTTITPEINLLPFSLTRYFKQQFAVTFHVHQFVKFCKYAIMVFGKKTVLFHFDVICCREDGNLQKLLKLQHKYMSNTDFAQQLECYGWKSQFISLMGQAEGNKRCNMSME